MAGIGLLSLAVALFLTIVELPEERPHVRRAAMVVLVLGGAAVLLMTPFASMALAALAMSW